jgi:hypothetical protein
MAWTNISNANLDVGAPLRSVDILALRDNIPAVANGDAGAPKIQTAGIQDAAVTGAKLSGAQSGSAPIYGARAWVNFNGTGTVAIRASGNVTSITDNGTGDYTVNFATAMSDANYVSVVGGSLANGISWISSPLSGATPSTSSIRLQTVSAGAVNDMTYVSLCIFR